MSEPIIPYVSKDLAEPADLVAAIRARRGGSLMNLDRILLHSPPFAKGWNVFLGEVRKNLSLSPKLREIAMCGVAVLNGAEYEFMHHAPELLAAGGSKEQVQALRQIAKPGFDQDPTWVRLFSPAEQDAVALTLAMTREIQVSPQLMKRLQSAIGDRALVELTGVIATYNMVSRFLIALNVTPEEHLKKV